MTTKRSKLKRSVVSLAGSAGVHDRRSTDLVMNARVSMIEVVDPYGLMGTERIAVLRSLRDDPLAGLQSRGQIDQAQYMAGRHWQRAHEFSEVGGARAIDPTKEAVDGGRMPEPLSDQASKGFRDLAKAAKALGMEGESIVRDVLGRHMTITEVAAKRGFSTRREIEYLGQRFREALETLAKVFGYVTKSRGDGAA